MKYYISDLHFSHKRMMAFEPEARKFGSIEEMDEELIKRWNARVADEDEVYVLGDVSFASPTKTNELVGRLKGKKYLIIGNHDNRFLSKESFDRSLFAWIKDYDKITDTDADGKEYSLVLFHYPITSWDGKFRGAIHLYGHIHGQWWDLWGCKSPNMYNVGADVLGLEPKTLDELIEMYGYTFPIEKPEEAANKD